MDTPGMSPSPGVTAHAVPQRRAVTQGDTADTPAMSPRAATMPPPPPPLTAVSPQETDQLEEEKAELESEIAELRKEKERLEFVLVAHAPACKVPFEDIGDIGDIAALGGGGGGGGGPAEVSSPGKAGTVDFLPPAPFQGPFPGCCVPSGVPAGPPNASPAFVFTHPEGATCGASHQRSGTSDRASDSLNSPSLLAL